MEFRKFVPILFGVVFILVICVAIIAYLLFTISLPTDCVGVIEINGVITTTGGSGGFLSPPYSSSKEIVELIGEAQRREEVKAVLFEINSPGGSVVASREIYEAIKELKKPKVSYFREIAASGAYYISVPSDFIISNPNTITGSIGVRATFEDLSGLFENIGINITTIKSGKMKDMGDITRPITEEEKKVVEEIVKEIFEEFKDVVKEGRKGKLNEAEFEKILDARILTGRQAKKIGLVDDIGTEKSAIKKAAELGSLESKPRLCKISKKVNVLEELLGIITKIIINGIAEIFEKFEFKNKHWYIEA